MTDERKPKAMSFYATVNDQNIIKEIQKLAPHYTFNFLTREGHRMLLRSLKQSSQITPRPKQRVEYNIP